MKRILHAPPLRVLLLLVGLLTLVGVRQAQASHAQAGQLTYSYIGTTAFPNRYRIQMDFFRDCSGITPSSTAITCRAGGCNGTLVSGTLTQIGQPITGAPYCPSVQATVRCDATTGQLTNYQVYTYQCTVDLPPAAEWIISWEESARPTVANIQAGTLRLEATLNNLITPVGGGAARSINNNSPVFSAINLPVAFVTVNDSTNISFSANDEADRILNGQADSLVYSLDRPLSGCGTFEAYLANPNPVIGCTTGIVPPPAAQPCIFLCNLPSNGATFGPTFPLPVGIDTVGACPGIITVQPKFRLNPQSGSIFFTPNYWNPNVGTNFNAGNKYVVVGKVTEYRKFAGSNRRYKVGSVRRDFLVIILQGSANTAPAAPGTVIGPFNSGGNVTSGTGTTTIRVRTCNYTRVRFNFSDPNNLPPNPTNNQTLQVFQDANLNAIDLQGGDIGSFVVTGNGTPTPAGTFYFQPPASAAGTIITTTLRIEDDACPTKGIQYRTIRIEIVAGSTAQAVASSTTPGLPGSTIPAICASNRLTPLGSVTLQGSVNRPDSVRVVAAGVTVAQTYSYQWTAQDSLGQPMLTNNGLPAVSNTPSVTVSPVRTTRYVLTINPVYGFGSSGTCGDVTTILVRVVPNPRAAVTARIAGTLNAAPQVCAGGAVALAGLATRNDALTDSYTYRWTARQAVAGSTPTNVGTTTTLNVAPTVTTRYTFYATGIAQYGCADSTSVLVQVVPAPIAAVTARIAGLPAATPQICAGSPVVLRVRTTRPTGVGSTLPDTYTYRWSGPGVPNNTTGDSITVRPTTLGVNTYTVTATGLSIYNCSATTTARVTVVPPPTVRATTNNAFVCPSGAAVLTATATAPTGFSDTYTYIWTATGAGAGLPSTATGAVITVNPTVTTRYRVTATGNPRTGCADTSSVVVRVPPAITPLFVTADSLSTSGQRTTRPPVIFTFTNQTVATNQGPNATVSYSWTYQRVRDITSYAVSPLAAPVVFATTATPAPLRLELSGYYIIRLRANAVINGVACASSELARTVFVPDNQVPNIITPNNDGLNDVFKITTLATGGASASKLEIYNRWGRKVYEQANYANNWGGDNQPAGVYYYLLTDQRNGAQTKGWIEVVR